MQVVCATCQLSFDAPEGATGLVCPICRGPLRPQSAEGATAAPGRTTQEWSAGDLDDLIAILSGPAVSARVEVLSPKGDEVLGEVHLLAGGVSESIFNGKSTDDALDRLRALNPTHFRVDQRLPNPTDGSLTNAGPETGTLDGRALAHLMRYCEDYVISCAIEVWRGNETARVEYKRGEISGVTVGGIDAPERLAEVMQWSSGNYRLIVPPFQLPATAPKRVKLDKAAMTPVPVPAASAQAARQASSTKTIFGIPVAELAKTRIGSDAVKPSPTPAPVPAASPTPAPAPQQPVAAAAAPAAAPAPTVQPAAAARPAAAPVAEAAPATSAAAPATRTIFGVPAASVPVPEGFVPGQVTAPSEESETAREQARAVSKTGARKVGVPAPAMAPPPAAAPAATPPVAATPAAATPAAAPAPAPAVPVATAAESTEQTTRPGYEPRAEARKRPEPVAARPEGEAPPARRQTSITAYVGVGFAFGLALLGVYELWALLAH
jgi:hypothetical protein